MARAPTNSDAFNAIAEPRRREILGLLCSAERAVMDVVLELELDQPSVSKHLRVLREVDLVRVRRDGRRRYYSANLAALDPVRNWIDGIGRFWNHNLDALQRRAEDKASPKGKRR